MDFRLKIFVSVAKLLSYTKAAKEMNISQPAVTKNIQELESIYKVKLLERTGNKYELTPAGEVLLKHALKIIAACEALATDMEQLSQEGEYADCLSYFISDGKRKKRE